MHVARRAAVLGAPIQHSLSPVLHAAAYRELGLDWRYEAIECGEDDLADRLRASGPEWVGFSCTMPLKRVALGVADEVAPVARQVDAANTLLALPEGRWRADNTDVAGIVGSLRECGADAPRSVALLGAGGTAQAAVVALAELGRRHCTVLVRSLTRAARLERTAAGVGIELTVLGLEASLEHDLVISTLPKGAADHLADRAWRADQVLLDAVYEPWPTPLAAAVAAAGGTVVSGALMLLHQAAGQVGLMTGQPAPLAAMRAALRAVRPDAGL